MTNSFLTDEQTAQYGSMLQDAWNVLRSLQGNKTASILRYTVTDSDIDRAKKESLGIEPSRALVSGLSDLDVYFGYVSVREVSASQGKLQLSDVRFVFWGYEVKMTDLIRYDSKDYKVVQIVNWDPYMGSCQAIARGM